MVRGDATKPKKKPCVYIVASRRHGTLYTGVTANLPRRACEHREGLVTLSLRPRRSPTAARGGVSSLPVIASRAKQSISPRKESMDCFVARAPRNDGVSCWQMGPLPVIASAAKQSTPPRKESVDCFVARALRNDEEPAEATNSLPPPPPNFCRCSGGRKA